MGRKHEKERLGSNSFDICKQISHIFIFFGHLVRDRTATSGLIQIRPNRYLSRAIIRVQNSQRWTTPQFATVRAGGCSKECNVTNLKENTETETK